MLVNIVSLGDSHNQAVERACNRHCKICQDVCQDVVLVFRQRAIVKFLVIDSYCLQR